MRTIKAIQCICVAMFIASPALAKPHKGKKAAAPAVPLPPSAQLQKFFNAHLDKILGPLGGKVTLPRTEVTQLEGAFTDQLAQAAPAGKPEFQSAIAVCNALNQTMDEREKAESNARGSAAVHTAADLGAQRRDHEGYVEYMHERHEEDNRKKQAAKDENFLNTAAQTQWTQRAAQLRQNIDQLYARERDAEQANLQAKAAAAAATPASVP